MMPLNPDDVSAVIKKHGERGFEAFIYKALIA
jgi:hypothetical protein